MTESSPERLIRFVADQLVTEPSAVRTSVERLEDGLKVHLDVAEQDRGKVIGKGGRTARALRSLIQAAGAVKDRRFQLEIDDE
jgi:predicted RNA-binding protein YlqC (UPF0109 family)